MADEDMVSGQTAKRKSKDSVFTKLFSDIGNVLELYKELHPEDTTVTEKDITLHKLSCLNARSAAIPLYICGMFLQGKAASSKSCSDSTHSELQQA